MLVKKTILVGSLLLSLNIAVAADEGYTFCGYKTQAADPETSQQFKFREMTDNYTIKPAAYKTQAKKEDLDTVMLGSGITLDKYTISSFNKENAKSDYVNLPAMGPFMMVYSDEYKKNIPAAWVYWIGDGQTTVNGHYQPYNRVLEPINFVFVVKGFEDKAKANKYLVEQLEKADFTKNYSDQHSGGYAGIFKDSDGKLQTFKQIGGMVNGAYHGYTFEDVDNPDIGGNHFRVFGPYQDNDSGAYIYTASISKESPRFYKDNKQCGHMFESFTTAKSKLAIGLLDNTKAKVYDTNLFTTIPDRIVKAGDNVDTYFTGDQQITNSQISNVAFVAVFDKKRSDFI
ncbi:hypothetical protein LO80_04005 [Candidatus Francisella endociliophora]|uniref:Uncharacterized protein n=1 Tax=Candidatus Francisella endociliophora TaxID=653937 RepID=A0A097ENS5_9GAMM|nr:hypothetical protein [Francisella sp. FSC1006]AIT09218.1 hypothetical protein LO80_04005 [Francisella sp. FSC1006]